MARKYTNDFKSMIINLIIIRIIIVNSFLLRFNFILKTTLYDGFILSLTPKSIYFTKKKRINPLFYQPQPNPKIIASSINKTIIMKKPLLA